MTVHDYHVDSSGVNKDILETLSDWGKNWCKKIHYLENLGKKRRKVPVLLTQEMKGNMDVLDSFRKAAGVSADNNFFFGLMNYDSLNEMRGHDCLRGMIKECELHTPDLLTSTNLRKHVATQICNLKEHELDLVASFLGHDIRVHR